ncbi:cell filamentation protein Fic, partial [Patescibacteria group bacterium]|nr:cell filamentation protein Fic [Patescibacteria group bacterium]
MRAEIQEKLKKVYEVSKPTLIRDLTGLIDEKLVRIEGKGKNTKYFAFSKNLLLKPFDIEQYFSVEPDERVGAKRNFDFDVFNHLKNLFSEVEKKEIRSISKSFTKETQKLNPDVLKRELERFIIELSWKSSKIEGNTYSLLETEVLIKESREAKGKTKEEALMILNHKDAFQQILENKRGFKNISLSEINQLHNTIVKNLNITPGIRKQAVGITGTVYQPLDNEHQIKEVMEKVVDLMNKNPNPLEKALIANSMISYVQPYS